MSSGLSKNGERDQLVIIALGSNLGNSIQSLEAAISRLKTLTAAPHRVSSFWRSTPVDCPPGSPDFVNAVFVGHALSNQTPLGLLQELQALEKEFGRKPKVILNEARPLDLDLIAFGDERSHSPELILPHPRAHVRKFVLQTLEEILPDYVLPGQDQKISELLKELNSPELLEKIAFRGST